MPVVPRQEWQSQEQYVQYLRHLSAYVLFATGHVSGKRVLEVGCGSGYGADYLSHSTAGIVALDMSVSTVAGYWEDYRKGALSFVLGNGVQLPFRDALFDVVVSFQVIEHIEPAVVRGYLGEVRRVLRNGGTFLCSTPNRRLRLLPLQRPWNDEHKREYNDGDFRRVLSRVFEKVEVQGLCATGEVQAIELARVKQSAVRAYLLRPVRRLLDSCLPSGVPRVLSDCESILRRRQAGTERAAQEPVAIRFSLDAFRVDPGCPRTCLDLYGVCNKVEH